LLFERDDLGEGRSCQNGRMPFLEDGAEPILKTVIRSGKAHRVRRTPKTVEGASCPFIRDRDAHG